MQQAPHETFTLGGFGLVEIKTETPAAEYMAYCLERARAHPRPHPLRRKLARAVARLANWICRDRDEGW